MNNTTPIWMTILIVVISMPLFSFPYMLSICGGNIPARTLVWIYPFYMLLSGWLAWKAYPRRPEVTWILLVVMVLSTCAVWLLANGI